MVQSNALDLCFWHMFRHSLMFQSGLSQTHSDLLDRTSLPSPPLPGEEDEESSPGASDHMPVPPPTSPIYFLPSHVEACEEQKGRETPLARAVSECSKKSMSLLAEGLRNELVWPTPHS